MIKAHDRSRLGDVDAEDPTCELETASAGSGSATSEAVSDSPSEDALELATASHGPAVSRKPGVVDALRMIMSA